MKKLLPPYTCVRLTDAHAMGAGAVGTWLMIHQPTPIIAEKCVKINIGGNDYDPVSNHEAVPG